MRPRKTRVFLLSIFTAGFMTTACAALPAKNSPVASGKPSNRVASILVTEDFLNRVFHDHLRSEVLPELKVDFDPKEGRIYFRGVAVVPVEEMRAINLDEKMSSFRFQVGVKPDFTPQGHLKLEFPMNETYFYPANSKDSKRDRVVVPVQMLSIALASARGYLAALSGDFSAFDRREAKMKALAKSLDSAISKEKNEDALEELKTQRESLRLKLESVPLERKQLASAGKQIGKILGFSGEKEMNLNDELGAYKNALILKLKLSKIVPYLKGVDLGGVRVVHNTRDGTPQDVLAVDLNANVEIPMARPEKKERPPRPPSKYRTAITLRMNQRLFETEAVKSAEAQAGGDRIRDLKFDFRDDGLHVAGGYKALLFTIPFDTVVDLYSVTPDRFEVRVRSLGIAGLDMDFLKTFILNSMRKKLEEGFPGAFRFEDAQEGPERILRVAVDPKVLLPAFPDVHLIDVDVRDRFFLMKVGHVTEPEANSK